MTRFFAYGKFRAIETTLMAISFYWAVILALPLNTFAISSAYDAMAKLAPEGMWAVLMFMVGSLHFFGMAFDHKRFRVMGLMLAAGQWYFIGTMLIMGNLANTAWGTYYVLAALSTWLYAKVGGQSE